MALERGRLIEILVSIGVVGIFAAVLFGIGFRYNQDGLGTEGGLVLIGAIGVFVLVMAGVGLALAYTQHDS